MTTQAYKICPSCKLLTAIDAWICPGCDRVFETKFVQPQVQEEGEVATVTPPQRPRKYRVLTVCLAITAVAFCGAAGTLISQDQHAVAAWERPAPLEPLSIPPPTIQVATKPPLVKPAAGASVTAKPGASSIAASAATPPPSARYYRARRRSQ